jgi:ABC-type polar amino acid transport system ATPase subunit
MIQVHALEKNVGDLRILRGITFDVAPRSVLGIIGGSGSGKTTLLRCLNGLERLTGGWIECNGVRLEPRLRDAEYQRRVKLIRREVGMVYQHLHLFPHLSALANIIEAPIHVSKVPRVKAETTALELLEAVGLRAKANRYPEHLSGGEQQRVAIARALAMQPDVLLFDEPTSALDPRRSSELRATLRGFVDRGHTMIVVTHSIGFLEGLADNILYMESGEAIEFNEADKLMSDPQDARTKEFLSHAR